MTPPPLATVTIKEGEDGSTVVLRTDRGAQVHYGPFAEDGVEAAIMHLGSAPVPRASYGEILIIR